MQGEFIGLIAAMPDEIRPLLRRISPWRREDLDSTTCYRFRLGDREALLVESGMGVRNAAQAANLLLVQRPRFLVNFGFAGAVSPGLAVGDIVLARRVIFRHNRLFSEQQGLGLELTAQAASIIAGHAGEKFRSVEGTIVTTPGIISKKNLVAHLPQDAHFPVVDMETSAIANAAMKTKTPLLAIRAVSDGAEEELGFSIEEFTNAHMKISIPKVLLTIAKKPWIIPQLMRLSKNSAIAGNNLAAALLAVLEKLEPDS